MKPPEDTMTPWLFAGWKHPEGRRCDHFLRPQWNGKDHAAARATKEFAIGVYIYIYMYIHVSHVCTCIYIYIYMYIYIYVCIYMSIFMPNANIYIYIYKIIYIYIGVCHSTNEYMNEQIHVSHVYIYYIYICIMIILIHDSHVCVFLDM